jgi:cob(I)alamin adenosyltransferase
MKIIKISKDIWKIEFDKYIDIHKFFITTGDAVTKLERIEKDVYKLLQDIFDIHSELSKEKENDEISYLETYLDNNETFIKAKKARARRKIIKNPEENNE